MSATTHVKVGILALLGAAGTLAFGLALGASALRGESIAYHSYFDESVSGLEIGAPVRYRGIAIGTVGGIAMAPDRRHVDVTLDLVVDDLRRVGLADEDPARRSVRLAMSDDLRAQLGTQGITGVKFLSLDVIPIAEGPDEPLPFAVAENHVPSAPSFMKTLEDGVSGAAARLPEIAETTLAALQTAELLLGDVHRAGLPARAAASLDGVDGAVDDLRRVLRDVDRAHLPAKTAATIESLDLAATRVNAILERVDGERGLVASTKRATDAVGDLGRSASGSTEQLDRTLRDLGEAAQAIRDLAEQLQRDPDMLVRGREAPRKR